MATQPPTKARRMQDKSALLRQLRVDREVAPPPRSRRRARWRWLRVGAVMLAAAAVGGLYAWRAHDGIPVRAAVAQPAPGAGANSLLDASGYVVAKRQATVSAKVTGKLVDAPIEEGQRVEKDQVV